MRLILNDNPCYTSHI